MLKKIAFLLMVAMLIVAAALGGRILLAHLSDFRIREVAVIDQNGKPVDNAHDFFRLDSQDSPSLFSFDMKKALKDIRKSHPELIDVFIRKQFPNKLLIVVKMRQPVAIIWAWQDSYLVDAQGFVLPFKSTYGDLPRIIGVNPNQIQPYVQVDSLTLKKALLLLKELKEAQIYPEYNVSRIDVREYTDIKLRLEDKIEVKMGQGELKKKVALLKGVLTQLKTTDTVPKYIDMRFADPVVGPQ